LIRWLEGGLILVCDRYTSSSIAYGEAFGLDGAWLRDLQRHLPPASLTIVLDIAPETAVERKAVESRSLRARSRTAGAGPPQLPGAGEGRAMGRPRRRAVEGRRGRRCIQRGRNTTRAAVSARTSLAPAAFKTRAHASSVAPVVLTSSISTSTRPGTDRRAPVASANASRTLTWRSASGNSVCVGVRRVRHSA
jgi:hypothetical protein